MGDASGVRPRLADANRAQRLETVRREIVLAASANFVTRGYHETSIVQIAEQLGTGPSTIYNYFSSKREILELTVERAIASFLALLARIAEDPPQTLDDFRATGERLGDVLGELFSEEPHLPGMFLIMASSGEAELRERWEGFVRLGTESLAEGLRAGVKAGYIRPDLDPDDMAAMIFAIPFGHWACDPSSASDPARLAASARTTVALLASGIRADRRRSPRQ